ncbi:MAG TPA: type II and III secretion system protein family protein [Beijerinckiaceae bacterium]|jgi:pilus assembly protein CpaC|nr:bacterial type and secretion system family protein [Microvirga sp.]HZB38191.1 type II and III secretion system protein family protein [Beijerinckiaceae bacterium]
MTAPEFMKGFPMIATRRRTARKKLGFLLATVGTAVLLAAPSPVFGRDGGGVAAAPVLEVGPYEQAVARRIDLSIGRSLIVDLPRDAKEVFVANPKVANAVVRSTRKLFVIGMENGATSIFVMDAEGRQIAALEVSVGRDLNVLRQTLKTALPSAQVEVRPAGDSILLTGMVASASEAQQAADIANAFVGVSAGLFSSAKGAVINSLTIKGKDQVMLRVTVAEVQRQVLKQLGVNLSAINWSIGKSSAFSFLDLAGSGLAAVDPRVSAGADPRTITGQFTPNGPGADQTRSVVRALERNGLMRLLAEPTLVAVSGESAKFLAGGEIPYAAGETFDLASGRTILTISYRPIGVSLNFTPVVLSERRISLRISTEVSELDQETAIRLTTISVPGVKTRRTETTVEVPSGASLVSAGLIQQSSRQVIDGFPGLKNLPILGALFRSRDYQRQETELMIMVTPYIAKPLDPDEVTRPDDGFVDSHDAQAVLLGRLNRLYGVAGAAPATALKGRFGFITD